VEKLRINTQDPQFMGATGLICAAITRWGSNIILPQNPNMAGLDNRFADLFRPLIAIGDYFERGDIVRSMARGIVAEFASDNTDGTQLLIDIRIIFDRLGVDRIEREHLLRELHKFDRWNEWGRRSLLTKNDLLGLLRAYEIPAVHPIRIDGKLEQGWYRKDFELAWAAL
jgi:hypothetical protein